MTIHAHLGYVLTRNPDGATLTVRDASTGRVKVTGDSWRVSDWMFCATSYSENVIHEMVEDVLSALSGVASITFGAQS
jgi:hypothetical protein